MASVVATLAPAAIISSAAPVTLVSHDVRRLILPRSRLLTEWKDGYYTACIDFFIPKPLLNPKGMMIENGLHQPYTSLELASTLAVTCFGAHVPADILWLMGELLLPPSLRSRTHVFGPESVYKTYTEAFLHIAQKEWVHPQIVFEKRDECRSWAWRNTRTPTIMADFFGAVIFYNAPSMLSFLSALEIQARDFILACTNQKRPELYVSGSNSGSAFFLGDWNTLFQSTIDTVSLGGRRQYVTKEDGTIDIFQTSSDLSTTIVVGNVKQPDGQIICEYGITRAGLDGALALFPMVPVLIRFFEVQRLPHDDNTVFAPEYHVKMPRDEYCGGSQMQGAMYRDAVLCWHHKRFGPAAAIFSWQLFRHTATAVANV